MTCSTSPSWLPDEHQPLFFRGLTGARVVMTKELLEIRAGVNTLTAEGGVVLVDGPPGLGKSFSTDIALAGLDIERIWIAMPDRPRGKETIARIWTALTGRRPNMRDSELQMFGDVEELLADRSVALVIDEGQHLQTGPLRQLRFLYDRPIASLLLVIVGSGVDQSVMRACPELYNRVDRHVFFKPHDLKTTIEIVRQMHPVYETATGEALGVIWKAAGGCIRTWSSILRTLLTVRTSEFEPLTTGEVTAALRINNIPTGGSRKGSK